MKSTGKIFKEYKFSFLLGIFIPFIFYIILMTSTRVDWIIKRAFPKEPHVLEKSQSLFDFSSSLYYELAEFDGKQKIYLQNSKNEYKTFYLEKDILEYPEILEFIDIVEPASRSIFGFLYSSIQVLFNILVLFYAFIKYIRYGYVSKGSAILVCTSIIISYIFYVPINKTMMMYTLLFILSIDLLKYVRKDSLKKIGFIIIVSLSIVYFLNHIISDTTILFNDFFLENIKRADLIFESIVVPNS